eukprot:TCONS_00071145-protein
MEQYAVKKIENCWCCYRDRQMFRLLKQAISTADHSFTAEVMRKISPNEAELLKDPVFKTKIRFRFSGEEFPPRIVFKVFIKTDGFGVKYLCGKKVIKPASQAASDSCSMMGNRKFLDQILKDLCLEEQKGVQNETELSSMKDYMKYISTLDETMADNGGRANTWRTLTLDVIPRHHIISDVLVYLQHGTKSENLTEFWREHLRTTSPCVPLTQTQQVEYIKLLENRRNQEPGRRSKKARERVAKMKKMYQQNDTELSPPTLPPFSPPANHHDDHFNNTNDDVIVPSSFIRNEEIDFENELWEEEGNMLFEWTKNLSLTNLAS